MHLSGAPAGQEPFEPVADVDAAARLWRLSEELSGVNAGEALAEAPTRPARART